MLDLGWLKSPTRRPYHLIQIFSLLICEVLFGLLSSLFILDYALATIVMASNQVRHLFSQMEFIPDRYGFQSPIRYLYIGSNLSILLFCIVDVLQRTEGINRTSECLNL